MAAGEATDWAVAEALTQDLWLVASDDDVAALSRRYYLRVVSLETMTTCNQSCYFCPVSIAPRAPATMPDDLFSRIVVELAAHRDTLEAIFLQSYNEPTTDPRFLEYCRALFAAGLPIALLSNGSALTAEKASGLLSFGRLRYLAINLSTLDPDRYQRTRGHNHLPMVLRNLDYLKDIPIAAEMKIVVLGNGDDIHRSDYESIRDRFAHSRFDVQHHVVMDRAGLLPLGMKPEPVERLAGCDNLGSRPFEHLHITPEGKCVLCCQDYHENYVIGDLRTAGLDEVLAGDEAAKLRRTVYGVDVAADDFICRRCAFARTK